MADLKTTAEAAATALTGSEAVRIVQGGDSKQTEAELLGHQFRGCRLERTTDLTGNFTGSPAVTFQQATLDTDGFWSAGAPTRATIPASKGFKVAHVSASVRVENASSGELAFILVHRNSAGTALRASAANASPASTVRYANASMGCVPISDGDYFDVLCGHTSDTSVTLNAIYTSLAVLIVGMEP